MLVGIFKDLAIQPIDISNRLTIRTDDISNNVTTPHYAESHNPTIKLNYTSLIKSKRMKVSSKRGMTMASVKVYGK